MNVLVSSAPGSPGLTTFILRMMYLSMLRSATSGGATILEDSVGFDVTALDEFVLKDTEDTLGSGLLISHKNNALKHSCGMPFKRGTITGPLLNGAGPTDFDPAVVTTDDAHSHGGGAQVKEKGTKGRRRQRHGSRAGQGNDGKRQGSVSDNAKTNVMSPRRRKKRKGKKKGGTAKTGNGTTKKDEESSISDDGSLHDGMSQSALQRQWKCPVCILVGDAYSAFVMDFCGGSKYDAKSRCVLTFMLLTNTSAWYAWRDVVNPFNQDVQNVHLWPAFFSAMTFSKLFHREKALESVTLLLLRNQGNRDGLLAQPLWMNRLFALLVDIPVQSCRSPLSLPPSLSPSLPLSPSPSLPTSMYVCVCLMR